MALIKCPECGHEISDTVETCTYCGYVLKKTTKNRSKKTTKRHSGKTTKRHSRKATKRRSMFPLVFRMVVVLVVVCGIIAYLFVVKPNQILKQAENLIARGKYSEAETVLAQMGDNERKEALLTTITLNEVEECIANGEYEAASKKLASIPEEKVSPEITREISVMRAESLMIKGEYDAADELLATIEQDESIVEMRTQLSYESRIFNCIGKLKKVLKNPDSLTIYEAHFYVDTSDTDKGSEENADSSEPGTEETITSEAPTETVDVEPQCVLYYGAQNGFGGNTTSYALFRWNYDSNEYDFTCAVNSLDSDDLNSKSDDYVYDLLAQIEISLAMEKEEIGIFDMNRIQALLMNKAYSAVKIVN